MKRRRINRGITVAGMTAIVSNGFLMITLALALIVPAWVAGQPAPVKIALSKASPNYVKWLKRTDASVITVDLYRLSLHDAIDSLLVCNALLLTGGEDVHPAWYNQAADTVRCGDIDIHRDTLEYLMIQLATATRMPVLGICRGCQFLNVFFRGSLIVDIPSEVNPHCTHQCDDYLHCYHKNGVIPGSLLESISHCDSAMVTTNHHQAVLRTGLALRANARSADNIIEGIEWAEPVGRGFLLGVQWHPERMDLLNPLSGPIAAEFIRQAHLYTNH